MRRIVYVLWLVGLVFAGPAKGQILFGDFGFVVQSSQGSAGDACWGFTCTPQPLTAPNGDTLTITVRAPLGAPYVVIVGSSAGLCLPISGIWHELVITPPWVTVLAGTIDVRNTLRFCYDGLTIKQLTLPPAPPGTQLAFQAAAAVGTPLQPSVGFALSSAVELKIL